MHSYARNSKIYAFRKETRQKIVITLAKLNIKTFD